MTTLAEVPHQRFTEALDDDVYMDVLAFHAKGTYALSPGTMERAHLTLMPEENLKALIGKDVSFVSGLSVDVPLPPAEGPPEQALRRKPSGRNFDDRTELNFSVVAHLLREALTADASGRRAYPSGGALYPVETYVVRTSQGSIGWPNQENVMRLRPMAAALEIIETGHDTDILLSTLSGFESEYLGRPHFALVYTIHLDRALFKYEYRGYRLAMMEIGSMYQMCALHAKKLGLENRVWAGFHDHLVSKTLGIAPTHLLPCVVQFFGRGSTA
jgi:SagB-type dehydrogenase family enzyme